MSSTDPTRARAICHRLGREAFERGEVRRPSLDKALCELLDYDAGPRLAAWLRGWDEANLAAPIVDAPEGTRGAPPAVSATRETLAPGCWSIFLLHDNGTWEQPTYRLGTGWTEEAFEAEARQRAGYDYFYACGVGPDPDADYPGNEIESLGDAP